MECVTKFVRKKVWYIFVWTTIKKTIALIIFKKVLFSHLAHLAYTASLAERADGPHVALVPGAKLGGVVVG